MKSRLFALAASFAFCGFLVCGTQSRVLSQDLRNLLQVPSKRPSAADKETYTPEKLQKFFRTEAGSYEIEVVGTKAKLQLREEPLLNWHNPERLLEQGSFFVWMDGLRPAVVGSIFTYQYNGQVYRRHEIASLISESLLARLEGQEVWKPKPAELIGTIVAEDLEPAETLPRRLTQMRTIARDVSGLHIPPDKGSKALELKPQPLVRYQDADRGIIDGALFALSVGTDPEILVMIEARNTGNSRKWHLVAFRSHFEGLEMSYKGQPVWNAAPLPILASTGPLQMPYAMEPYFTFSPAKRLPPAGLLK